MIAHRRTRPEVGHREEQDARQRGPELVDVAFARFRYSQAQRDIDASDDSVEAARGDRYRSLRTSFEDANGDIIRERWGAYGAAGLVITERHSRWLGRFCAPCKQYRLYRTSMCTESAPEVEESLAEGDALAAEIMGVLRGPPQRAMLEKVFAAQSFLFNEIDESCRQANAECAEPHRRRRRRLGRPPERREAELLQDVRADYHLAARRRAQYIYMQGAFAGLAVLVPLLVVAAFFGWWSGYSPLSKGAIALAFACALAGGFGAVASVSWRVSLFRGFNVDPGASVLTLGNLGMIRAWIGAIFGVAACFALKGGLLNIAKDSNSYYFMFLAFVAGFSERMIPDLTHAADPSQADDSKRSGEPKPPVEVGVTGRNGKPAAPAWQG